jgi:hypothetical protein
MKPKDGLWANLSVRHPLAGQGGSTGFCGQGNGLRFGVIDLTLGVSAPGQAGELVEGGGRAAPGDGFEKLVGEHSFSVRDQVPPNGAHDFRAKLRRSQNGSCNESVFRGVSRSPDLRYSPALPDTGPPHKAGFVFLGSFSPTQTQITSAPARKRLFSASRVNDGARDSQIGNCPLFQEVIGVALGGRRAGARGLRPNLVEQLLQPRAEWNAPPVGERGEAGQNVGAHFQVELGVAARPPAARRPRGEARQLGDVADRLARRRQVVEQSASVRRFGQRPCDLSTEISAALCANRPDHLPAHRGPWP